MVKYALQPGVAEQVIGLSGLRRALEALFGPFDIQPFAFLRDGLICCPTHLLDSSHSLSHRFGRRGIALINSIGNLGGFVGPYAIGWVKDATGATTLALVALAACCIMAGLGYITAGA
jgi:hypothetical protein